MDSILQDYLSAGRSGAQDNLDRASYNNTLQDIFKKKLEADRYSQLTPHEVNIKALEGDRASMMRDPGMLDAYGAGQLGTFQSNMAKGMEDMGTVDSRIDKTNAENSQAKLAAVLTKFSQIADFVDAAFSRGGDQGAMAMLQQVSPELAAMYQKEVVSGKSGKQIVTEFKTRLGQIKDQMMQNASYDPKYYAESRLHAQDNASRERIANIGASSSSKSEGAVNQRVLMQELQNAQKDLQTIQKELYGGVNEFSGLRMGGLAIDSPEYAVLKAREKQAVSYVNELRGILGRKTETSISPPSASLTTSNYSADPRIMKFMKDNKITDINKAVQILKSKGYIK